MSNQGFFGPPEGIDSKDYLLLMENASSKVGRPDRLIGHTLGNANVNLSDALQITRVELSRGRIRTFTITKRAAEERSRSYTVGYPSGALSTPAMDAAKRQGARRTFFLKYLCPTDSRYNHARVLEQGVLGPAVPEGEIVTVDEVNPITESSSLDVSREQFLFALGYEKIHTIANKELLAIRFLTDDCPTAASVPGLGLIAVGGDGTAAATNALTEDRFANTTTPAAGGSGNFGTSVFNDGALVVVGYADENIPAGGTGATAGAIYISNNGGVSFAAVSGITVPIYGIDRLGSMLLAVGGTGAGAARLFYSSNDGASWTSYSGTLPASSAFTDVEADNVANLAYIVGEGGKVYRATAPGSTVTLIDISANLPGSPGDLYEVAVLGENHVMIGGASGYLIESENAGKTWVSRSIAGSTAVYAIGGNTYRTLVGVGSSLYERSILTDNDFALVTLEGGQTFSGVIRAIAMNVDGDFNLFAIATDDGEIALGKGYAPNT